MSDMSSMNRENKKKQLRRQVVTRDTVVRNDEGENTVRKHSPKGRRRRRFVGFLLLLCVLGVGGFVSYRYYMSHQFSDYSVNWEVGMSDSNFVEYINFGSNVLKYSKDGASYIDDQGKTVWTLSYEMKSPVVAVNGDYAAIADQQGNSIYICNKEGNKGVATTLRPILKVTVSAHGVVSAILDDAKAILVNYFKNDGTPLDIEFKGMLQPSLSDEQDGNEPIGYPVDISLSPDGTQLIGSYLYLNNGVMKGRVAFHNFSEIGKSEGTRLVAGFDDDFSSSIIPRVRFLTEIYSCAFADDGLAFFSSNNLSSPELIKKIPVEDEIRSIFFSDKYVGIIVDSTDGSHAYRMEIYKADGSEVLSKEFDYPYTKADIDGDYVILYNESSCKVFNMSGSERFSAEFDWTLSKVRTGRFPNTLILAGPQVMKEIKFK